MTSKPKGQAAATPGGRRTPSKKKPGRKAEKLTDKEELFAAEYVVDWNGADAVRRAGYIVKSDVQASVYANRLLKKDKVKTAVEKAKANALERAGVRAERVVLELAKLSFASAADILMVDEDGNVVMRPGSEIPRAALDAVSLISASDTVTERDNGKGAVSSTRTRTVSLKLHDKRAALVDLGRYLRLFSDKPDADTNAHGLPATTGNEELTDEQLQIKLQRFIKGPA